MMTVRVLILEDTATYKAGEIVDCSKGAAADLVNRGLASKNLYVPGEYVEVTKRETVWQAHPADGGIKKKNSFRGILGFLTGRSR